MNMDSAAMFCSERVDDTSQTLKSAMYRLKLTIKAGLCSRHTPNYCNCTKYQQYHELTLLFMSAFTFRDANNCIHIMLRNFACASTLTDQYCTQCKFVLACTPVLTHDYFSL